ncbi:MAG: hypothetical protein K8L99_08380 [Anaerolineae bacterium]|nr:hypothetical protein [Anaerolineae bacterium]
MLKYDLIPTPLLDARSRQPVQITSKATLRRTSSFVLFFRLVAFGMSLMWASRVRRRPAAEIAQRVRDFLENLGGLWIKAGQLISLRIDVLSPEMADELSQLQYQSFGFDPQIARQVIETSLGRPIAQVFDTFDDHPFAAASISQVHRARLRHNGAWVAVKVQRPGIDGVFKRDLGLIRWLLRRMNSIPAVSHITWDGMIRELERMMHEEIDYRYEIANLRRMRKVLRKHKVYVPKVYRKLSAPRVIVMEYISGVVMSDYMRVLRSDPARVHLWECQNNIEPRKVGSRLMRSFYRQLFEDNIFHGDLHPGNIVLLRDSRFALIDFGTVGNLEKKFIQIYAQQARAFAEGDYSKAIDLYMLLADSIPVVDVNAYRAESVEIARAWEARTHMDGLSFLERSITGGLATDLADVNRRYRVNPSWQFLRVARSLSTMDANLSVLLGNENPNKILRKYFQQARRRGIKRFREEGIKTIGRTIADSMEVAGYFSESLRRQAIQMRGAQSKVSQFFELVMSVVRFGVVILGIVLLYDFLHAHHFNLLAGIHDQLGAFKQIPETIPPYAYEVGIVILIGVLLLFFAVNRAKRIFAQKPVRLPNGRIDR